MQENNWQLESHIPKEAFIFQFAIARFPNLSVFH